MLKEYLLKIETGNDRRSVLLELKKFLKGSINAGKEISDSNDDLKKAARILMEMLSDDDPKVRQNSALCLGMIGERIRDDNIVEALYNAYIEDLTKYNKAAYLEALGHLNISPIVEILLKRRESICNSEIATDEKKHFLEEMRQLNTLLRSRIEKKHEFTGFSLVNEAALLTNRNFKNVTICELGKIPHKEFSAGVMVKTKNIRKVMECRTFTEILFIVDNIRTVEPDAEKAAEAMIEGGLTAYLEERHTNPDAPFFFRVELRNKDEKKKADLEKKLAAEIEIASKWKLINSTSNYDIEFRFIENSSGKLQFLIGMRTFPDTRFDYRKRTISAGMKPSLAALLVNLSKEYLKDNASVIDPMCGSGIFLIEREKFMPTRIMYGVDIFGEGIAAAQENIRAAGISRKCELINKNILEFSHKFRFDEMIVDMPRVTSGKDRNSIEKLYMDFLEKAKDLMENDGYVFVLTHNRDILRKYALKSGYMIKAEYEISKMEEAYYFILQR